MYEASRLAARVDKQFALEEAVALEPATAAYHNALGRYLIVAEQDTSRAVSQCKRATELDPYCSRYWLDLAQAYFVAGAEDQQRDAIRHAVAVDPTTPEVAWNAANFFLVQGDISSALAQFAVVLRYDSTLVDPALDECWRAVRDVNRIKAILPSDPGVYLRFAQLLINRDEAGAASQVWSALIKLNKELDFRSALFYVEYQLHRRDISAAYTAWADLAARSPELSRYLSPDDAVTDGDFSHEFLDGGFDWRYTARPDMKVSLDTSEFHSGNRSLALSFTESASDSGLFQVAPVEPNTRYTISAWVKSEELKTAFGPRIIIADPYSATIYAMTDETLGTTVWHRVATDFETGPSTHLVAVRFGRNSANTQVEGRFWVDDVSLRPTAKPASP
jgi:tetratricopeptide (TPR) repeat protein